MRRVGAWLKPAVNAVAGALVVALLRLLRLTNPDRIADFFGWLMRRVGPWLSEHRIGRANLTAAFPEKSPAEIEAILSGAWDNLGRVAAEYAHLDRLWDFDWRKPPPDGRITITDENVDRFLRLRYDGKPALIFAAHLGNWEIPAIAGPIYGLRTAILYRAPNIADVAEAINRIRAVNMGTLIPTGSDAVLKVAAAVERGEHVGMLVDQHFTRGVDAVFFGRVCKVNPLIARLAQHYGAPIHGVRCVRLPGHRRFRLEMTPEIVPTRDADGRVDVVATMQAITAVVEGWVREHPEQWLWQHRRWR
jgi:KDO2-lipid IV(A) lauroyltransferase